MPFKVRERVESYRVNLPAKDLVIRDLKEIFALEALDKIGLMKKDMLGYVKIEQSSWDTHGTVGGKK